MKDLPYVKIDIIDKSELTCLECGAELVPEIVGAERRVVYRCSNIDCVYGRPAIREIKVTGSIDI